MDTGRFVKSSSWTWPFPSGMVALSILDRTPRDFRPRPACATRADPPCSVFVEVEDSGIMSPSRSATHLILRASDTSTIGLDSQKNWSNNSIVPLPVGSVKGAVSWGEKPCLDRSVAMSTESQQPAKLRASVEDRFRRVAREPDRERKFPVGPESAKRLGYGCGEVDALPSSLTESFRGAGNPAHRARTTGRPVRAVLRYARSRAQPRSAHLVRQS